jgi:hypothetical protein
VADGEADAAVGGVDGVGISGVGAREQQDGGGGESQHYSGMHILVSDLVNGYGLESRKSFLPTILCDAAFSRRKITLGCNWRNQLRCAHGEEIIREG